MPIYEYECEDCGKTFETFVKVNDPPVENCVHCNSTRVKKLVSNCSFQLKGTGWYVTDYGNKNSCSNSGKSKTTVDSKSSKTEGSAKSEKTCSGKAA